MTCHELGLIARDYVRAQWLSAGERERASLHLSQCATCQTRVAAEVVLTAALGKVREGYEATRAPRCVDDAVLAAFDAQHKARPPWRPLYWAIPAAAALLVGVALTRTPKVERPPVAGLPETRVVLPTLPPRAVREAGPIALQPAPRRPQSLRAAAAPDRRVTEFIPLRFGKPVESGEQLQVFRMQMRRSELMRLGLPVAPDAASAFIQADVLLGEDGLAKAIRFVY